MNNYLLVPEELLSGAGVLPPIEEVLPLLLPPVLSVELPPVPLLPLLPGVAGAVSGVALGEVPGEVSGVVLELPVPLSEPLMLPVALPPVLPVLPAAPGVELLPLELGGVDGVVLGEAVVPEVLEPPVVVSGVPASFFPHAVSARAATRVASKTEYFMSVPLKKTYLSISTLFIGGASESLSAF